MADGWRHDGLAMDDALDLVYDDVAMFWNHIVAGKFRDLTTSCGLV